MREHSYQYKHLPIPGGGYVTGFIFHKKQPGLLYLRTDIGGTYRFDREGQRWHSLISHVTPEDLSETFPISVALDEIAGKSFGQWRTESIFRPTV